MSISGISSASSVPVQPQTTPPLASNAKAADGDYKTKGAGRSTVKDGDGDYKPTQSSAAATSSSAVQSAVTNLKAGG